MSNQQQIWGAGFHAGLAKAGVPQRRRLIDVVLRTHPNSATPLERLTVILLAMAADKAGTNIQVTTGNLAAGACVTPRQMNRTLRTLRDKGIIEVTAARPGFANVYCFSKAYLSGSNQSAQACIITRRGPR